MDVIEYSQIYEKLVKDEPEASPRDWYNLEKIFRKSTDDDKRSMSRDAARNNIRTYFAGKKEGIDETYSEAMASMDVTI